MVTAKNLILNSKTDLGWATQDADYTTWRNNVKDYCAKYGILSKTKAGEDKWQKCLRDIPKLDGFKASIRARLQAGSEFHLKALEALAIDTLKKRSETSKKLAMKRAVAGTNLNIQEEAAEEDEEEGGADSRHAKNAVLLWLVDPLVAAHRNNMLEFLWDSKQRRKLGILQTRDLEGIWQIAKQYIPAGRTIREIQGALADLDNANPGIPEDYTILKTDAEVDAFLKLTAAQPIRLLLIMHRNDGTRDTPGPEPYFAEDQFDPPEMYDDPCEDSDALVRNAAGVAKRRLPTKDHTFEERKGRIRRRIRRQQQLLLNMKRAHKEKCPGAPIVDSEEEEFCYTRFLKNPVPTTGAQLVKARSVIHPGRRATNCNIYSGATRVVSKMRGIYAAQFFWERMHQ